MRAPFVPRSVQLWDELSYAPVALAASVLALAALALVNALVTSVRRRHRDLAVVKAVRCSPPADPPGGGVAGDGLGAGGGARRGPPRAGGRSAMGWEAITTSLGLHSPTAVPLLLVTGAALSIVVIANLVALLPARAAARVGAATALRTE